MWVFVLNLAYDYEGESTLGVFSSLSTAWESMQAHSDERNDVVDFGQMREGEISPDPGSSHQYQIRKMLVDAKPSK